MNYGELVENIRDLGFADDEEMAEFKTVVKNAINRAISEINNNVPGSAPRNEQYDFSIDDGDEEALYIDMEDIDDAFMDFAETSMLYDADGSGKYVRFNDYDVINESTIVIEPEHKGDFRVLYKVEHEKYEGTNIQLTEEIPLARRVHHLVPLLASYYVWLEDEPQKAEEYMTLYKDAIREIKEAQAERPRGRIVGRGI